MGKSGKLDATKCKTQCKLALTRINLQRQKRVNGADVQGAQIAQMLRQGKDESARIQVETVIRDAYIAEVLEICALFAELLMARMGILASSREPPPDLQEAVATIIYAAPRLEIKELSNVRTMMVGKFGKAVRSPPP
jgi:vacuolar protein sorting-associated protein IST1